MTTKDFSDAMNNLDLKYIQEAQEYKPSSRKRSAVKLITVLGAAAAVIAVTIAAIALKPSPRLPAEGMEVTVTEPDRIVYYTLPELEADSDIIVVGEYVEIPTRQLTPESGIFLSDAVSRSEIRVTEVLQGDGISAGDRLAVTQRYGVLEDENRLVSFSGLTPMNKGDSWIFFLNYDEESSAYWCTGDVGGRYPLPEGEAAEIYRKAAEMIKSRDEWLLSECEIFSGEMPEGSYMAMSQDGTLYLVPEDKGGIFLGYELPLTELRDDISPELFGVWDAQNINLQLYCAAIDRYFPQQ